MLGEITDFAISSAASSGMPIWDGVHIGVIYLLDQNIMF